MSIAVVNQTILLVEDETSICAMIRNILYHHDFVVRCATDTTTAQVLIDRQLPDLMLLDWMLPGGGGLEFTRQLRQSQPTRNLPIIMLTAKGEEEDRLLGFDAGVDDYVVKPFSINELIARIRAVLKRSGGLQQWELVECEGLQLDPVSHRILINDQAVKTGPTEFKLLHFFMTHPERVFTREQLLVKIWSNLFVEPRTVDVHIRRLRKMLAPLGKASLLQTVHGIGYRFSEHS